MNVADMKTDPKSTNDNGYLLERTFGLIRSQSTLPDHNSPIVALPNATWEVVGKFNRLADAVLQGIEGEQATHQLVTSSDGEYVYFVRVVHAAHCIYRVRKL